MPTEPRVLLGLRSAKRDAAGQWCLPTGKGAIRRDISSAFVATLAADASKSLKDLLKDPMVAIRSMTVRRQQAFLSPGGFALAEAKWYVQIPSEVSIEQLKPLKPIPKLDNKSFLIKIYFGLEWLDDEPPKPAETETEWPFVKVQFFSKEELKNIPIAFDCDKDLEEIFWSRL